jgi:hypothetical protein
MASDKRNNVEVLNRLMWFQPNLNVGFRYNQFALNMEL